MATERTCPPVAAFRRGLEPSFGEAIFPLSGAAMRTGRVATAAGQVVQWKAGSAERLKGASIMVRVTALSSPLLLGFEGVERALDKASKAGGDGYPPYNIERIAVGDSAPEILRITLAVAGFSQDQIEVTQEENQLSIRGRQNDDKARDFIYRGIAARQFHRSFLLAEGMQVRGAEIANGLLSIDVVRPQPDRIVKKINIAARD
jgi:HSP20 family molecular chaperone IbpA